MAEKTTQGKKISQVKSNASARKKAERTKKQAARVKLLVSIVNANDEAKLKAILDDVSIALSATFSGTGTARSAILDYFGIGETEKKVVFSLFPDGDEKALMREIRSQMSLYLVGRGISFTVPLTGVSEIVANGITNAATNKNTEGRNMNADTRKYTLVVAILSAGYVDDAMKAARAAGAAGGTIVRSRSLDNKKAEQFIGISLAVEQEILLILCKKENAMDIMEALSVRVGVKTEAGGIIFSLPVDRTVGIGADEADEAAIASDKEESRSDQDQKERGKKDE